MNREDKSIPKVMYDITFWMIFLYWEASRCTSGDCKLFFNSLTSPFLFESLKYVVELADMLNNKSYTVNYVKSRDSVHLNQEWGYISLFQSSPLVQAISKRANDVEMLFLFYSAVLITANRQKRTKKAMLTGGCHVFPRQRHYMTFYMKRQYDVFGSQSSSFQWEGLVCRKRSKMTNFTSI